MKKVSELFKEIADRQLKDNLKFNSGLFFFNYSGASSANLTQLRRDLKSTGARMFVTKNNFINVGLRSINIGKELSEFINGPTALVFVKDDPVGPSKVLAEFAKNNNSIKLKGGYIHDKIVQSKDFKILASIPPRQVLYQQVAIAINGPIVKLATSLNQIIAKVVYAIKAVSDKKQKEPEAKPEAKVEAKSEAKQEAKPEEKKEAQPEEKKEAKVEEKKEEKPEEKKEAKPEEKQ